MPRVPHPSWSSRISPARGRRDARSAMAAAPGRSVSHAPRVHATRRRPRERRAGPRKGPFQPCGARKNGAGSTPARRIASRPRSISSATVRGPAKARRAWVWPCNASSWPRRAISRTSSGRRSAASPRTKKVARASARSRASSTAGVSSDGPSSKVSATRRSPRAPRRSDPPPRSNLGQKTWSAARPAAIVTAASAPPADGRPARASAAPAERRTTPASTAATTSSLLRSGTDYPATPMAR